MKKHTIAIIFICILSIMLAGCGSSKKKQSAEDNKPSKKSAAGTFNEEPLDDREEDDEDDYDADTLTGSNKANKNTAKSSKSSKENYKITAAEGRNVTLETYECSDFSMKIPSGWKVTNGGVNMYHSIRVYDPKEPLNQIFFLLKADYLMHSEAGKDFFRSYEQAYGVLQPMAYAPALEKPTIENLYKKFSEYVNFILQFESTYSGYTFPQFDKFSVMESFPGPAEYNSVALDNKTLRASFTSGGKKGEGMFTGFIVNAMDSYAFGADCGYYSAYYLSAITTAEGQLIQWQPVLTECLGSLDYSGSFVNYTQAAGDTVVRNSRQISSYWNSVSQDVMSSWASRNRDTDIAMQKQSDKTLGYDRVYDTKTGTVYRASYSFTGSYTGDRYKPATDDMYAEPVDGYIE